MLKPDNNNIFCSVSAGYSSVMMAIKIREWYPNHNIINVMANTSKEKSESLDFMDKCDKHYNLDLIWIEAVINQEAGVGTNYKVVKFKDLDRKGNVFENGIKKFGIPFNDNKWCNRDLKLIPMQKFANDYFGNNNYSVAVGIRADEIDRVRKDYKTNNVFYPLLDKGLTVRDRNKFWSKEPIKLTIPAFEGNCDLCFQKSDRKLMTILKDDPNSGDWWQGIIDEYGKVEKPTSPSYNDLLKRNGFITFYRGYKSINDLIEMAKNPFTKATDEYIYENDLFDAEDECGSGCSVF